MRVDDLAPLADGDWDAALEGGSRAFRFSHRSAAGRAFERAFPSYAYTGYRAQFSDGAVALFPLVKVRRRLESLSMLLGMPLGLEGTPIALEGRVLAGHIEALIDALRSHGSISIFGGAGGSPPPTGRVTAAETHVMDLTRGFDELWEGSFTAKNRNVCRKADKAGVEVSDAGAGDVDAYWDLYAAMTRGWGKDEPPYPRELFVGFLESGHAELWLGRLDGQVIAGALLLRGSHDLLYWSGAMDREHGGVAPSNAVLRDVIRSACDRRVSYLDFGASVGLPGVEAFKRSFGAQAREYISISSSSLRHRALESSRRRLAGALRHG